METPERGLVQSLDEETELAMYTHGHGRARRGRLRAIRTVELRPPRPTLPAQRDLLGQSRLLRLRHGRGPLCQPCRELNVRNLAAYLQRVLAHSRPCFSRRLSSHAIGPWKPWPCSCARRGIDRTAFQTQTGFALDELLGGSLRPLIGLDLLIDDGVSVKLSRGGQMRRGFGHHGGLEVVSTPA